MKQKSMLAVLLVLLTIGITSFGMAFAEGNTGIESGLQLGIGLVASGGVSGAILSIVRVTGKAIKQKPESMDQGQFFTNIIVGTVIGVILSIAGLSADQLQGNQEIISLAVISSNFMFVYIVNETLRPMFSKFTTNWGKPITPGTK